MKPFENAEQLKQIVKEQYSIIADQDRDTNAASCCGTSCCTTIDAAVMAEDYTNLKGYSADADLGLGCGLPTEFARIKEGDTVVDLGSGAGNDSFVARSITGPAGKVIGIDFTEKMITKARLNNDKLQYNNVEFRFGDIEEIPVHGDVADVVVSNCVLNLVPDKRKAFEEIFRILKKGGHFSVSDIVLEGALPDALKKAAEMYVGCVSGAIQKNEYLNLIQTAGFENTVIQKEKQITIPDEILKQYLSEEELVKFQRNTIHILSITVYAEKPATEKVVKEKTCCGPECCAN